tara:strand:- start:71 stop:1093 length:1023 start_codon:yes stop_codon:yes gene_type:complete
MGGLARKSTIITTLKSEGHDVIVADAGNLFFKKDKLSSGVTLETAKETSNIIVECFNAIGCDVFSPGSHDFAAGFDFLKILEEKSDFPFISANIFGKYGEKIFEPYVIIEKQGKKIGFLGLASVFMNENVTVKDPFKILKSIINELESKTDMVILLFNASEKDLNRLKTKNYAVDFAVRSRSNLPPKVSKDGGSSNIPVYSIGMRGKYVFEFDINIGDTSSDFIDLMYIQSKLEKSEKFLRTHNIDFEESVDLDAEFKDDPKTLKQIKNNLETRESLKYQLNNAVNYFSFEKYSLDKQIKDDLRILSIIDKGKARINELHGPVPDDKGRLPSDPHHGHNH